MDTVERVWRRDFANATDAIRDEWLIKYDDGFVGIDPEYRQYPAVVMYHNLMCVGYARGWM